jgi:hypothetical protein
MAKKKKIKYYLSIMGGQTIKTDVRKHPALWLLLDKEWDNIVKEYEEARENSKGIFMNTNLIPRMKFNEENWKKLEKETGLRGSTQMKLGIDSPNGVFLYLQLKR